MKKSLISLLMIASCLTLSGGLTSCEKVSDIGIGKNVVSAQINEDGELILTLSDGSIINAGKVKGDKGDKGDTGATGSTGKQGEKGDPGEDGKDGVSIKSITKTSTSGNVDTYTVTYSDSTKTTFTVTNGEDGTSPVVTIGENGNWYINGEDTGKSSKGINGANGKDGVSVIGVAKTSTEGLVDTYTITYSDGNTSTFFITNGAKGDKGDKGDTGKQGEKGDPGEAGKDGVSIVSVEYTSSNDNVDTYTITYSDETTSTFSITNGKDGTDGKDGQSPVITIGENGNWFINSVDTGKSAKGVNGTDGKDGDDGVSIQKVEKTSTEGLVDTYTITYSNGNTSIFYVTNGAKGDKGDKGDTGKQGEKGDPGEAGKDGVSIISVTYTSSSDNVDTYTITYSDNTTTTFNITNGKDGDDGKTPEITIGNNGNWYINGEDTGKSSLGSKGDSGDKGEDGTSIVKVEKTNTDELTDTYTITYSNGSTSTFFIKNGAKGEKGDKGDTGADGRSVTSITKTGASGNVDTYTITYSDETTSTFTVTNGKNGEQGIQGAKGEDGKTPVITINGDGYWCVDGASTGVSAKGEKGDKGDPGEVGKDGVSITSIKKTSTSDNVDTYTITYSDETTSTFTVTNGKDGTNGENGTSPEVTIGDNGNWYINGVDTGKSSKGINGTDGSAGKDGVSVRTVEKTNSVGLVDTYTITYSDGSTSLFYVTNGAKGDKGEDGKSVTSITKTDTTGNVDTYTITYSDNTTSTFTVTNGEDGKQGIQGVPGEDGKTPVITIDGDGYWCVDGTSTGVSAKGEKGDKGDKGDTGAAGKDGSVWHNGKGLPSTVAGAKYGDYYLDKNTGAVYCYVEDAGWTFVIDIKDNYKKVDTTYYVDSYDELEEAYADASDDETIALKADLIFDEPFYFNEDKIINFDLAGHTIYNNKNIWGANEENDKALLMLQNGTVVIEDSIGTGKVAAKENDGYAVAVINSAHLMITGGEFVGNVSSVYVEKGSASIYGGTYSIQKTFGDVSNPDLDYEYTLDLDDTNATASTAVMRVYGGTYYKFDPSSCHADGEATNYLANDTCSSTQGTEELVDYYSVSSVNLGTNYVMSSQTRNYKGGTITATETTKDNQPAMAYTIPTGSATNYFDIMNNNSSRGFEMKAGESKIMLFRFYNDGDAAISFTYNTEFGSFDVTLEAHSSKDVRIVLTNSTTSKTRAYHHITLLQNLTAETTLSVVCYELTA